MIGFTFTHPEFLGLLLLLPVVIWAWHRWPPPLSSTRGWVVLVSRLLLIMLLAFALSGVRLTTQPNKRALVAVVDLSASVKAHGNLDAEASIVRSLQSAKGPDDLFGVVTFGHDAAVELPLTRDPAFENFQTQPDPSYSDLAGAVRLAAGLLPDGYARQLVLISDGRQNLGDAASAVAALRAEGVRVDVIPVGEAPAAEELDLGLHTVRAELTVQPDTYTENNVGEASVRVLGRPLVLVLEGKVGEGANVAAALQAAGMDVERR